MSRTPELAYELCENACSACDTLAVFTKSAESHIYRADSELALFVTELDQLFHPRITQRIEQSIDHLNAAAFDLESVRRYHGFLKASLDGLDKKIPVHNTY